MSDHEIHVHLTPAQFLKYRKGASFQLSNSQLKDTAGKHRVDIHLGKRDYKKLLNAVKNGKGYRFSAKNVTGGSLWDTFKKGAQFVKDNVDKDTVKSILKTGVDYAVPDDYKDLAKSGVNLGVDVGYGKVFFVFCSTPPICF